MRMMNSSVTLQRVTPTHTDTSTQRPHTAAIHAAHAKVHRHARAWCKTPCVFIAGRGKLLGPLPLGGGNGGEVSQ